MLTESTNSGLNYSYHLTVKNSGKNNSPQTTLAFTDNNNPVKTGPTENTEDTEKKFSVNNNPVETFPSRHWHLAQQRK
jgi:hypothetical protein